MSGQDRVALGWSACALVRDGELEGVVYWSPGGPVEIDGSPWCLDPGFLLMAADEPYRVVQLCDDRPDTEGWDRACQLARTVLA